MAIKAKLKFDAKIPWSLEQKLITKYGFRIFSRNAPHWIIVEKIAKNHALEVLVNGELPEHIQDELTRRCKTIVGQFQDVVKQKYVIRLRINTVASTLPPQQRKFVHEWLKDNIGEE